MPKCKDKKYESLYYKSLSVQKVNIHSPEGKITRMWTTPDRVPHRHMWMWDSAFHSLAMSQYNPSLAEEILLAMLSQTRDDGFMPHMANPTDSSDVTQPCVMSYATYKVYEKTHNKEFLKEAIPYLEKYLNFDMNNRDKNHNGLLEWYTEPEYQECKCGESGLDNSPRFDFDEEMDIKSNNDDNHCENYFQRKLSILTEKNARFINLLGGEPLLHSKYIKAFCEQCPKEWRISIESSLNVPRKNVEEVLPFVKEWIIDIKDINPDIYKVYSGITNERVIANLQWIASEHPEILPSITLRLPLIPEHNTDEDRDKSQAYLQTFGYTNFDRFDYIIR